MHLEGSSKQETKLGIFSYTESTFFLSMGDEVVFGLKNVSDR